MRAVQVTRFGGPEVLLCVETDRKRAADGGAELLVAPAAWVAGPLKEEHLSVLARARAINK
jgi:predicted amidohydrolase